MNELKYLKNAFDIVNQFETDLDLYRENGYVADSLTLIYEGIHLT